MSELDFSGNYSHNIDPKGRVTIPVAFRDQLGDNFTIGLNNEFNAIAVYPQEKWHSISQELDKIPDSDRKGMRYVRLVKAYSFPGGEMDTQGRILLPQTLRQKLSMEKNVRLVGMGRYLEIWDENAYMTQMTADEDSFDDLMDYVNDRYMDSGRGGNIHG